MDKDNVVKIARSFSSELAKEGIVPHRLILFGSHAKGNAREDSDIDLVVVSPVFEDKSLRERLDILSNAICAVWEPIEAIGATPEEWEQGNSLILQFARDGELVHEAA